MSDKDVLWAVARIVRAIKDGRATQAYAITFVLAHALRYSR